MIFVALTGCHPLSPENCSSYNSNVLYAMIASLWRYRCICPQSCRTSCPRLCKGIQSCDQRLCSCCNTPGCCRVCGGTLPATAALLAELEGAELLLGESSVSDVFVPEAREPTPFPSAPTKCASQASRVHQLAAACQHMPTKGLQRV